MINASPVVVGGNGHSGTRIFIEILEHAGVFSGVRWITKRKESEDLRMIDLLNKWVGPYVFNALDGNQKLQMRRAFSRRLRFYFPVRRWHWGFKNPRCMLILPMLHELFPDMRFVHVVRDGRDIALGNPFASSNRYVDAYLAQHERSLPAEQKMILFWGRSNQRAMEYGISALGGKYKMMRWEDLCRSPLQETTSLIRFAGAREAAAEKASSRVAMPGSIGRWATFPAAVRDPVVARGRTWLDMFGYN
jgi:hypothetical protein